MAAEPAAAAPDKDLREHAQGEGYDIAEVAVVALGTLFG